MSVNSKMTAIAGKIRSLLGITGAMGLDAMATNLGTEQTNVANAFTAVGNKGGTVPSSKVSGNLASAIASIPEGATVQIKPGTVTGVSGSAKAVNVGFKPDAVFFTGTMPQLNNQAMHTGVAFTAKNVTSMTVPYGTSSTSYVMCILTVAQVSNGFTVSGIRINTSGQQSNESNRSIPYIAIKYTE
jgi:hypothetical protein